MNNLIVNKGNENMKRLTLLISSILLIFILGACSSSPGDTSAQAAQNNVQGTEIPGGSASLAMRLALGTFKLEETDLAITPEQASELLPLWKAALSLSQSDNVAAEELEAVFEQIQETLSEEQGDAITAMELSFEDMASIAEQYDLDLGRGGGFGFGDITPEMQATAEAARESGEFPDFRGGFGEGGGPGFGEGGGPGPGGGFFQGEPPEGVNPEARQTAIAERGGSLRPRIGVNTTLIEALIEFLEAKIP